MENILAKIGGPIWRLIQTTKHAVLGGVAVAGGIVIFGLILVVLL